MNLKYLAVGAVLTILLVGVIFGARHRQPVTTEAPKQADAFRSKGPVDAPIQIIEYSDFQCPACKNAEGILSKIFADYPHQIRLVFRHFPLAMHRWSQPAHQAVECAGAQGKFWPYHDKVFAEQEKWSAEANPTETFLRYAAAMDLNIDQFVACMEDSKVREAIMTSKTKGEFIQVNSTPTFFINGERIVGPRDLENKGIALIRKFLGLPELPSAPVAPVPSVAQSAVASNSMNNQAAPAAALPPS